MGVDNSNDVKKIKSKISTIKTVVKEKDQIRKQKQKKLTQQLDEVKTKKVKQVKEFKKNVKKEVDSLYAELIQIYKQTNEDIQDAYKDTKKEFNKKKDDFKNKRREKSKKFVKWLDPTSGDTLVSAVQSGATYLKNTNSAKTLGSIFFVAVQNTRAKIKNLLIEDIISTIGCSEEQSYDNMISTPIYIKLKNVDLFGILKTSPEDEYGKLNYEKEETLNGVIPYSMNRQLYRRLVSPQSFSQQYGQQFTTASGNQLFDIQYVDNYVDQNNIAQYGDFFKVTLNGQFNNRTKVSDFLNDYFASIDVFNLDMLMGSVYGQIYGSVNIGISSSQEELTQFTKFLKVVKRLMGICTDTTKKIDITGNGKMSDLDLIDDSFFEVSSAEQQDIEETVNRKINGLVTFEDCGNVNLPVNTPAVALALNDIITENKATGKINLFFNGIEDLSTDQNWQNETANGLNISLSIVNDVIANLPTSLFKTIISPKVMLGFMIMIKAILANTLDFEDLSDFLKKFKKFVLRFTRNVIGIFIEELSKEIKKNIKRLVSSVIKDIKDELKNKQIVMYTSILEALIIVGKGILDYRECKSVIDDILNLLKLIE
jgi:hypothetical protein